MDALIAIAQRHSTRAYSSRPVPKEILERIVDAGRRAPTARDEQPWNFVVVTDAAMRRQIAHAADYGKFIAEAAACIVVFCKSTKYYLEDGCAATENMLVAATALGVQSCWVAGDKKPYCSTIAGWLSAPSTQRLVSIIALGYADSPGQPKPKRPLAEVLHWEKF